ncbi:MAG: alanine--glyoxylate aminotransferase family protein, partial [candidate division NC10 bacterium]|nr:alanine--glyoxylate aminotransferase family protein [candidate division NC10 bacterium]
MKKFRLLAPGPTPVPPEVLLAMAQPVLHHRTPEFEALFGEARRALQWVFQTRREVLVLAASGTGAMEGAVVNACSPGDRVLVIRGGKFGERWAEICQAYGLTVIPVEVPYGKAVDPQAVAAALRREPGAAAVFATHSETSTGVLHDLEAIAAIVRQTPALLVADGITSLGVVDLPTDAWGVDVVVAGSQKAMMLPPGLAFACLSDRAWAAAERARLPRYYFNFLVERKIQATHQTAWTPAISLIAGLKAALDLLQAEGLPAIFARHERLARATRTAVTALGLEPFAERPSPAVTAVKVPEGVDGGAIVRILRDKHGISIAGGQGSMKGKIFRIATLGYADAYDVLTGIAALEFTLAELGYPVRLGDGLRA